MSLKSHRFAVLVAFAVIYVVWGSTYLAIRVGLETIPPFFMAGARFLVAAVPLYAWVRWRSRERPTWTDWKKAMLLGTLMLVGGNGLVTLAETRVPSGLAALMVTAVPIWMTLLGWLAFGDGRPNRWVVLGLVTGPIGIAILVAPGLGAGGAAALDPLGATYLVLSSFSWATGSLLARRWSTGTSALLLVAMEMLVAAGGLTLVGLLTGEAGRFSLAAVSSRSLAAVVYLAIFGSIAALSAYVWLLKVTTAHAASSYAFVNPVVALGLGALLAGEPFDSRIAFAGVLILGAVVVLHLARGPAPKSAREPENETGPVDGIEREAA